MSQAGQHESDDGSGRAAPRDTEADPIQWVPEALRGLSGGQLLIRFAAGAGASLVAALVSQMLGAEASGPLLALPTILIAGLTLLSRDHGRPSAIADAHGAVLGGVGMVVFAVVAWLLLGGLPGWVALGGATAAWVATSIALYGAVRIARRVGPRRRVGMRRGLE